MKDIINVLREIQQKLKAPKNQKNTFGNYNYRSCEDILEAVKPLLPDGCALVVSDKMVCLGNRFYIKATATLSNVGQEIKAHGWAREAETKKGMDDSQITGSTSSYARKYALNGLFLIDDTKDSDATNEHDKAPKTKQDSNRIANYSGAQEEMKSLGYDPVKAYTEASDELDSVDNLDELKAWARKNQETRRINGLPDDQKADLKQRHGELKTHFQNQAPF